MCAIWLVPIQSSVNYASAQSHLEQIRLDIDVEATSDAYFHYMLDAMMIGHRSLDQYATLVPLQKK